MLTLTDEKYGSWNVQCDRCKFDEPITNFPTRMDALNGLRALGWNVTNKGYQLCPSCKKG